MMDIGNGVAVYNGTQLPAALAVDDAATGVSSDVVTIWPAIAWRPASDKNQVATLERAYDVDALEREPVSERA